MTIKQTYPDAVQVLERSLKGAPNTSVTELVKELIDLAKRYDLYKNTQMKIDKRYRQAGVVADVQSPPYFDHDNILGAVWADNAKAPLERGEQWNCGRRATLTGVRYKLDEKGLPINPYQVRGVKGRGLLGAFGPNYTMDNGAVRILKNKDGKERLHVTGIIRKDNGKPAFAGGFAESKKLPDGSYLLDKETIIETLVKEFFEEMVSGSVDLLPEYVDRFEAEFEDVIDNLEKSRGGKKLSLERLEEKRSQFLTELKYDQVKRDDPGFFERLTHVIASGRECYAGPVMNSTRVTDNAWIETVLQWYFLDDDVWSFVKGDNPVFNYRLSAGDDAANIVLHDISSDLVREASASHGAMFVFLGASYLLDCQEKGRFIQPSVMEQFQEIVVFLKQEISCQSGFVKKQNPEP